MRLFGRLTAQLRSYQQPDESRALAHGPFPGDRAVLIDLLLHDDTFIVAATAAQVLRYQDIAAVGLMLEALSDPRCDDELEDWLLDAFLGTYVGADGDFQSLHQVAEQACAQLPQARATGMTRLNDWLRNVGRHA